MTETPSSTPYVAFARPPSSRRKPDSLPQDRPPSRGGLELRRALPRLTTRRDAGYSAALMVKPGSHDAPPPRQQGRTGPGDTVWLLLMSAMLFVLLLPISSYVAASVADQGGVGAQQHPGRRHLLRLSCRLRAVRPVRGAPHGPDRPHANPDSFRGPVYGGPPALSPVVAEGVGNSGAPSCPGRSRACRASTCRACGS